MLTESHQYKYLTKETKTIGWISYNKLIMVRGCIINQISCFHFYHETSNNEQFMMKKLTCFSVFLSVLGSQLWESCFVFCLPFSRGGLELITDETGKVVLLLGDNDDMVDAS